MVVCTGHKRAGMMWSLLLVLLEVVSVSQQAAQSDTGRSAESTGATGGCAVSAKTASVSFLAEVAQSIMMMCTFIPKPDV